MLGTIWHKRQYERALELEQEISDLERVADTPVQRAKLEELKREQYRRWKAAGYPVA